MLFRNVFPTILIWTSSSLLLLSKNDVNAFTFMNKLQTNSVPSRVDHHLHQTKVDKDTVASEGDRCIQNVGLQKSLAQVNVELRRSLLSFAVAASLFLAPNVNEINNPTEILTHHPPTVLAADYGSFSEEQKVVAEAWRIVDNNFIDRTFNNQDWFQIRQDAVVKHKYKNIQEARDEIDKIVGSLGDKYTRYLPPAKYRSIVDAATGTLAGVGVEISSDKTTGKIFASDVEPSSPALNGGIKKGDIFLEVDGTRMDDGFATPDDVASKLRGPEGSRVGIVMERDGNVKDFILTRKPITITSVRSYISESSGSGKVGVIRIKSFSGTTADTVKSTLADLKNKGAEKFLIDVRGNPGGLLPGGTDTAGLFLEANKPLVFVVDKKGVVDAQSTFQDGMVLDAPLVVLVNGNTASAAEVMTAALKENGRATIVGEQTFGKGIIQTIRQLSNENGGVAVTVAKYETPQHNNINKQGISVDITAACVDEDAGKCVPASAFKKL
mmetsp:Transcript_1903/g.2553  ORF Transcript_1903/g.2553 Transcript_1903/m.2553 type:complete len:497 (-) Transcript_1903:3211-4701(-)